MLLPPNTIENKQFLNTPFNSTQHDCNMLDVFEYEKRKAMRGVTVCWYFG